ncbi:MAG: hypothetical protein Q8P31_07335 [Bacillota bacterium]|nr:hypothetical protein [Bacillota bacterium]
MVLALVGASGTGKSYQASFVAHEFGVDVIVDDGLLVREGKILAGRSAKAESTRVGAIKRAIFSYPEDAAAARAALAGCQPQKVLVLGTSLGMIARIVVALDLPSPARIVHIEDVSRPGDIRRARRVRREQGKHVIPAPTLEVRKTFSGYLIDPLRFFLRPKGGRSHVVVEKSVVRPTWSSLGRFYINDVVIISIALRAAREVEGVGRPMRATVDSRPEGTTLHLELALRLGCDVVQVCRAAQLHVRRILEYTTGLDIPAVNVTARTMILTE